ncbi:hypothetical protein EX30DRAFT_341722, partial [Ascodesmis nigricans]
MDTEAAVNKKSIFYTPVPTKGTPTEILVNRFNAWRRVLKDFITYFKEVQSHYETRSRGIAKLTNTLNVAAQPSEFIGSGGILETNTILRDFHKEAIVTTESAAKIESEIVRVLVELRNDLAVKIKEIKGLSGDFKNSVDKQKDVVRKEIAKLEDTLAAFEKSGPNGKDPYLVRLEVEKRVRQYLTEENYLHKAYLNLENSGRELEKIVVTQIQKVYSTYVNIITHEGQELLDLADRLTASTLRVSPDHEWFAFVERDPEMISPTEKLRTFDDIEYPGYNHPGVLEIMSGPMERKSKYLKSFTGGWYVLTPTHLHEFKYGERLHDQTPVLSLPLADSNLGKHADPNAVSHKFVLRGRQTGSLHRGHSWVFRAETHEKMMEWYSAIQKLTQASATERNDFIVRATSQRLSGAARPIFPRSDSESSEMGLENDEADEVPYSSQHSTAGMPDEHLEVPVRPEGGRFPSDLSLHRDGQQGRDLSTSSDPVSNTGRNAAVAGTTYAGYNYANLQDDQSQQRSADINQQNRSYGKQLQELATYGQASYGSPIVEKVPSSHESQRGTYGHATQSDLAVNNYIVPVMASGYDNGPQENNIYGNQTGQPTEEGLTRGASTASKVIPYEEQRADPPQSPQYHVQTSTIPVYYQNHPATTTIQDQNTATQGYPTQPPDSHGHYQQATTLNTNYVPVSIPQGQEQLNPAIGNDPAAASVGNPSGMGPGNEVPRAMPTLVAEKTGRPASPNNTRSSETISNLHVPGEYPRGHGLQHQDVKNVV